MAMVCACSIAACVSPRSAEYRDTAHGRAPSGTHLSIKSVRHLSRRYGSSPSSRIAGMGFPFSSRDGSSFAEIRAILPFLSLYVEGNQRL